MLSTGRTLRRIKKTDLDIYFLKSKSNNGIIIVFTSSVTILPMKAFCSIIKFISLTPFDVGKSLVGVAEGFASCGMFKYLGEKIIKEFFNFSIFCQFSSLIGS